MLFMNFSKQFFGRCSRLVALLVFFIVSFPVANAQAPGDTANDPFWTTGTNQVGNCGSSYNFGSCTANDFRITNLLLSNVVDACSSDTDYLQADLTVSFSKAQPIRYDVMAYFYRGEEPGVAFGLAPDAATTGDWCTRIGLQNGLEINNPGPTGSFTSDIDGDQTAPGSGIAACFDSPSANSNGTISQTEFGIVLPCRDGDADGVVDISACTGWSQSADPANCSGPEYDGVTEPSNGTGSKCNCASFNTTPAVTIPDMSVSKVCAGDDAAGNGTNSPDVDGKYFNGDVVLCTITISNAIGAGTLDGATNSTTEGFFYIDDYDESTGSVGTISVNNPGGGSPTSSDATPMAGMLTIYPDDIAAGDDVVVTYLYTIGDNATGGQAEVDISNTVCLNYFDTANGGTTTAYADAASGDCATDTITTTPVTLADFNVYRHAGGFQFNWVTATETNNIGFNIYASFGQSLYKINTDLITSDMISSLEPTEYSSWLDSGQFAKTTEFYLEDLDIEGNTARHGPFTLSSKQSAVESIKDLAGPVTNWGKITSKNAISRAKKNKSKKTGKSDPLTSVVNIRIQKAGLQRISLSGLASAGFSENDMAKGRYVLTNSDGGQVASRVVDTANGGYLEFVSFAERNFYSNESVYQLRSAQKPSSALEMSEAIAVSGGAASEYYMHTETLDDDNRYVFTSKVAGDPWMMNRIVAIGRTVTSSLVVPVSNVYQDPIAASAVVTAELAGGINFPNEVDHKIDIEANSQPIASLEFDGLAAIEIQGQVSMAGVSDELSVDLKLTGINARAISLIYTNKVSLMYPREYVAIDNQLSFDSNDAWFTVDGFTDQRVYAYARSGNALSYIGELETSGGSVSFAGVVDATGYQVFGESSIGNPSVSEMTLRDLNALAVEHIVIAHPLFVGDALDNYLLARTDFSSGSSAVVTTDEIYARYSGGLRDANAIHSFIKEYAQNNDLKSVMIVGGDVYDYHDNLGIGAQSFVPTLYRATGRLIQFSPVDSVFGDIDDNGVPDIAVGRLPVRTVSELVILLDKMKAYTDKKGDTTATFAADAQRDDSEYDFAASSDSLADVLQFKGWNISKAYIDDLGVTGAKAALINGLNSGPRLALYTGHSGPSVWSADKILTYSDTLSLLNVNSPSAYIQWGCYNTYFTSPYSDSMSHGLMLTGQQGAAIVIGSSTLTNATAEAEFAALFQREIIDSDQSYGEAFIQAKKKFAASGGLQFNDILWGVTLLGDPLLAL